MDKKRSPDASPLHYRVKEIIDEDGVRIAVEIWTPIRETPEGYWVRHPYGPEYWNFETLRRHKYVKWVPKKSGRRYCYPEFEKAMESFYIRKSRQIGHLKLALSVAKKAVRDYDKYKSKTPHEFRGGLCIGQTAETSLLRWE